MIRFNDEPVRFGDGEKAELDALLAQADRKIREKNGEGNDFLGWIDLPDNYDREELKRIQAAGDRIAESSDVLIVIGIGGSYLGAKAALDFLRSPYYNSTDSRRKGRPEIYFLGNSFSGEEIADVLGLCEGKRVSVNVISKSGTTTEPAIAFRFVREYMESRYSAEELKHRIFATTDRKKGALLTLAKQNGYETFVIPDDIGGRFSVLTAVGLLPLAAAGCDVRKMLDGAKAEKEKLFADLQNKAKTIQPSPSYWTPILGNTGALFINTEVLKQSKLEAPKSIADLAKPEYAGHISVPDIMGSSTSWLMTQAVMSAQGEEAGAKTIAAIEKNAGAHLEKSGSAPLKKLRAGEAAVGFGLRHQAVADKARGLPIDYIDPTEGNFQLQEAAAVVDKGAKTNPNAQKAVEIIVKYGRPELLKFYPVALYEGETVSAENKPARPSFYKEPLTVELLQKHQKMVKDAGK